MMVGTFQNQTRQWLMVALALVVYASGPTLDWAVWGWAWPFF